MTFGMAPTARRWTSSARPWLACLQRSPIRPGPISAKTTRTQRWRPLRLRDRSRPQTARRLSATATSSAVHTAADRCWLRRRCGSVHLPWQQAELVALRVGQHTPRDLGRLANVDPPRPEGEQALEFGVLVSTGRVDVDVDAVLNGLWLWHGHKDQCWRAA